MKILFIGIDPGTRQVGYSIILSNFGELTLVKSGTLFIGKDESNKLNVIFEYFSKIFSDLKNKFLCETYLCVESQFVFKNPSSAFSIITAKSIFLLLAQRFSFISFEMAPLKIKKLATGNGASSKEDVQRAMSYFFKIDDFSSYDESDAMATSFAAAIVKTNSL